MSADSSKGRSDFSPWPDQISAHVLAEILSCHQSWRHGTTDTPMSPQMIDDGLNGAIDYLRSDPVRVALVEALKPFARLLADHHERLSDDTPVYGVMEHAFTVGDIRRADAALRAAGVGL